MNTKEKIINQYKKNSDLLVKRNLLHLLNKKFLNLSFTDEDNKTEDILTNIMNEEGGRLNSKLKMRYNRYYNAIFELV